MSYNYVLTLIAKPRLTAVLRDAVAAFVSTVAKCSDIDWLAEGEACDIHFELAAKADLPALRQSTQRLFEETDIDAFVQPAGGRRKRLLVADMDSTIIEQECIDEIAEAAGVGDKVAAITGRAMRGELDFEAALVERVNLIRGFPLTGLKAILDRRITLTPGATELTATMRANGGRCVLVSGGFTFFTSAIAERAGFDASFGNTLKMTDGCIDGVEPPILGRDYKLEVLRREAQTMGIDMSETMAVGDGANDLAMIGAAGLGVAFRAKAIVAKAADARITAGDLTSLLFIQGYRRSEFGKAALYN